MFQRTSPGASALQAIPRRDGQASPVQDVWDDIPPVQQPGERTTRIRDAEARGRSSSASSRRQATRATSSRTSSAARAPLPPSPRSSVDAGSPATSVASRSTPPASACSTSPTAGRSTSRTSAPTSASGGRSQSGNGALRAYLDTILAFYRAEPVEGFAHLHGRKANRMVHVGATDAPVTIDETEEVMDEMADNGIEACDLLGWEWEMGLHDTITERARRRGLDLRPRQIPREVMERQVTEADAVRFFELAHVDLDVRRQGHEACVVLKDFAIPSEDLIPPKVREQRPVVVGSHRLLVGRLRLQRRGLPQPVAGLSHPRESSARDAERLARVPGARALRDRREDHRHLRQRHDQARRGPHQVSAGASAATGRRSVRGPGATQAQRGHVRRQRRAGPRRRLARAGLSRRVGDVAAAARVLVRRRAPLRGRPAVSLLLLPARGRRDLHLPDRDRARPRPEGSARVRRARDDDPARRAQAPAAGDEDGDGLGQDDGDEPVHRLVLLPRALRARLADDDLVPRRSRRT